LKVIQLISVTPEGGVIDIEYTISLETQVVESSVKAATVND